MSEGLRNEYVTLFAIRLLHHYWLDDGFTVFDLLTDQKKAQRLQSYDVRSFLTVKPTAATARVIGGVRGIFKETALGCMVAIPKDGGIPENVSFDFVVTVRDPAFHNYTAFSLSPQMIHEYFCQPEKRTYRYKENVPLLSNMTGTARGEALFLSREIPTLPWAVTNEPVESLFLSGTALMQLTRDQACDEKQTIHDPYTELPVFVHQDDIPVVAPPLGLSVALIRGIQLIDDMPDNLYAFIRMKAVRGSDPLNFVDVDGKAKIPGTIYEVRFKNRSTFWQYINRKDGSVSIEAEPFPLTWFGNASAVVYGSDKAKQKPSGGLVKTDRNGDKIIRLVSEIYI